MDIKDDALYILDENDKIFENTTQMEDFYLEHFDEYDIALIYTDDDMPDLVVNYCANLGQEEIPGHILKGMIANDNIG